MPGPYMQLLIFFWLIPYIWNTSLYGVGPHPRWPQYSIGFANRTKEQFSGVEAQWVINGVKYNPGAGMLAPGSEKEYSDAADPIPPSVSVVWKTPDGKQHRQTLDVPKQIRDDPAWTGTLWFKFTDNGVEIIPLSKKQMDGMQWKQIP